MSIKLDWTISIIVGVYWTGIWSKHEMFTPTAKEECSKSLARVMEIQRQAALNHISSPQTMSWSENLSHVPNNGEAFISLYQSIEDAAAKRSEKTKPLPCPSFPKLPQKKTKAKLDADIISTAERTNNHLLFPMTTNPNTTTTMPTHPFSSLAPGHPTNNQHNLLASSANINSTTSGKKRKFKYQV